MKVKKYVANSEKEAIKKVKDDLGSDAIILNSRKIRRSGFLGFLGKKKAEVTVAVEENFKGRNSAGSDIKNSNMVNREGYGEKSDEREKLLEAIDRVKKQVDNENKSATEKTSVKDHHGNNQENGVKNTAEGEYESKTFASQIIDREQAAKKNGGDQLNKYSNETQENLTQASEIDELKKEINHTKNIMEDMLVEFKQMPQDEAKLPLVARKYYYNLKQNGVTEELVKDLVNNALNKMTYDQFDDENNFFYKLKGEVSQKLNYPVIKEGKSSPEVCCLIGPTGVGKTTTVAKLAARYTLMEGKQVGLITVDTYRIAAVEQLKTYGDILSLPVEVVMTPQGLKEAIKKFNDKDIILIDTAGRSHKNEMQMSEIKNFVEAGEPNISYLVLSVGTHYNDLKEILNKYSNVRVDGYIFTKIDETEILGNILNVVSQTEKGFSYITDGQDVPDDIEEVDVSKITDKLLGD